MNNNIHTVLNQLRLISKIKSGQSLYVNNTITIYEVSFLNWIWRKWNRDNKEEVIKYLQDFYKNIMHITDELIKDYKTCKDEIKQKKLYTMLLCIADQIKNSVFGLENLSITYTNYPKIIAELEGIVQDFIIVVYNDILDVMNKEEIDDNFNKQIKYGNMIIYKGKC